MNPSSNPMMDQAKAGMADIASLLADFRKLLIDGGYSKDAAETICIDWAHRLTGGNG